MTKALARYNRNPIAKTSGTNLLGTNLSGSTLLIGLGLLVLIIWLVMRNKSQPAQQYLNKEEWSVEYNSDGLPTKISIHRDATRS